ncbi:unnamed protein product [marine sediment metagenome]|uniref:Uncharacterized protein n=1 Tax=marine sediment metagenome TaxID=412755 RepID=X1V5Y6_9ZZZZ
MGSNPAKRAKLTQAWRGLKIGTNFFTEVKITSSHQAAKTPQNTG